MFRPRHKAFNRSDPRASKECAGESAGGAKEIMPFNISQDLYCGNPLLRRSFLSDCGVTLFIELQEAEAFVTLVRSKISLESVSLDLYTSIFR